MSAPTPEQLRHAGQLYRHRTGWLYREVVRNTAAENIPEKATLFFHGPNGADYCVATDLIVKGEEFVVYASETGKGLWARPATLFDDGRFVPVPAAPEPPDDLAATHHAQQTRLEAAEARVRDLEAAINRMALRMDATAQERRDKHTIPDQMIGKAFSQSADIVREELALVAPLPVQTKTSG